MTEFTGWEDQDDEGEEEESTIQSEEVYWRKPIKVGDAILGDMVKYHQSREEFINDKAKDADIFKAKYQHVIDGYRKMETDLKSLKSLKKPKIPQILTKAPQIRKEQDLKMAPIPGERPKTMAQNYGYLSTKPECNLQIFGNETVKPMHSCKQLLGFEYEAQR